MPFQMANCLCMIKPMAIKTEILGIDQADVVFDWVMRLLRELGDEGDELGELARDRVLQQWKEREHQYFAIAAKNESGNMIGIITLSVAFAVYANGEYGVIDEMYVDPAFRSSGIGVLLIEEAKKIGKQRGWKRIDVTAPESERWERTRRFYEKQGFQFTGPKLKLLLDG
jgi:GNAT superfamily N-acetyltransferase